MEVVEYPRQLPLVALLMKLLSSQGLPEEDLQQQAFGIQLGQLFAAAAFLSQLASVVQQPVVQAAIKVARLCKALLCMLHFPSMHLTPPHPSF